MRLGSFVAGTVVLAGALAAGIGLERTVLSKQGLAGSGTALPAAERRVLYWWDPMLPAFRSEKPGKSPMGMEMVPVYEGDAAAEGAAPGTISVSAAVLQNLGTRTVTVARAALTPSIETFGAVAFDESRISHVHVRARGWVERLQARVEGEPIGRGQLLFEFFAPELMSASYEFLRELQRNNPEGAENARRKLVALGLADRQIEEIRRVRQMPERIQVFAPRGGALARLNIAEGMFVEPDMTLMSIAELDQAWVLAEVIESQVGFVTPGIAVEVRISGEPGRTRSGTVDYIYPDLRPDTRTARVRIRLANTDRALKPNMFAMVRLMAAPREPALVIPAEALIQTGRGDRVVLALGDGRFRPVPVRAGVVVRDRVEILEGLQEDDRVVASAQFLLDSESSLTAGLDRLDARDPAPGTTGIIWTDATVEGPPATDGSITLSHPPIPAIGWPAMTMEFAVDPAVSAGALTAGRRVRVGLVKNADSTYRVAAAEPAP